MAQWPIMVITVCCFCTIRITLFAVTPAVRVKLGIADVEVLRIESILQKPEGFAESLEMYDLALSQETDGVADFRIFDQAENVIVSGACFLFCRHILEEIGDQVALALEFAGIERNTAPKMLYLSDCNL